MVYRAKRKSDDEIGNFVFSVLCDCSNSVLYDDSCSETHISGYCGQ